MNFIRHWRDARGMTLQALGEAIEPPASAGTIHTYESGARDVSLKRLAEIARVLEVTPGKLLDGPAPMPTQTELAAMLEIAQSELPLGVSLGGYPTAVAASLHAQLVRYLDGRAKGLFAKRAPETSLDEDVQSRRPTKRAVRG